MRYTNVTTKEAFQSHLDWAEQRIEPLHTDSKTVCSWTIYDRFMNQWKLVFTGNVGEFTVGGINNGGAFVVAMCLSGDKFEIVEAFDRGRCIRSDRLLKKYKELALMVSNYLRFGYLKI